MSGLDLRKYQQEKIYAEDIGKKNTTKKSIQGILNKDITLLSNAFPDKQKEAFYIEMSIMMAAGVDIRTALDLVAQTVKEKTKKIVLAIKERLVRGSSLSDAFKQSGYFSAYEFYSINIGEETGKLPQVLQELASFYTKKIKQRRQFINALSYPAVILFTSIGAVAFMLSFIVPMFSDVFKRFGGELPEITQWIIRFSAFLNDYIVLILLGIIFVTGLLWINKNKTWYKRTYAWIIRRLPVIGPIFSGIYLARFSASMALLIGAKVPLLQSIQLVRKMISFYPIKDSLEQVEKDILQGKSLHESLSSFDIYDARMIALLKVGGEVNQLGTFFEKLAYQYSEDVEHRTSLLSTFLEPLMIIFLGLVVGFILIAMYLPMFQLSTTIGG